MKGLSMSPSSDQKREKKEPTLVKEGLKGQTNVPTHNVQPTMKAGERAETPVSSLTTEKA